MPIFNSAWAKPMVRTKRSIWSFCSAKTCSTRARTADFLALARQTLTDWADPAGTLGADILLAAGIDQATGNKRFDPVWHAQKLQVLFGSRARLFVDERSDDFKKATLRLAIEGVAQLRHNSFHFNGLGGFTRALQLTKSQPVAELRQAITALWVVDLEGRALRLTEWMES